jgi:hypothetical protein
MALENAVFFYPILNCSVGCVEKFGGPGNTPLGFFHGLEDNLPFNLFKRKTSWRKFKIKDAAGSIYLGSRNIHVRGSEYLPARNQYRFFDDSVQLPHVARPKDVLAGIIT